MLSFVKTLKTTGRKDASADASGLPLAVAEIYKYGFSHLIDNTTLGVAVTGGRNETTTGDNDEQLQQLSSDFDAHRTNQVNSIEVYGPTVDDVWIFGYGSLVWKADFPYIDRRRGYVCGYKRRFYQHSIDHRGVPEKPGRVVTLLPGEEETDRVYGVAYRIADKQKHDVLNHLDYREKNGYERCSLQFHEFPIKQSAESLRVIMYVATQANDSYAGDVWQVSRIAEQIFSSAGPSGTNREYLFNLDRAMRALFPGAVDDHLNELVSCVWDLIEREESVLLQRALCKEIHAILVDTDYVTGPHKNNEDVDILLAQRLEGLRGRCACIGWREALIAKELSLQSKSMDDKS